MQHSLSMCACVSQFGSFVIFVVGSMASASSYHSVALHQVGVSKKWAGVALATVVGRP